MGRTRTVPAPSCPEGHTAGRVHARELRPTKRGTTRVFRCLYVDELGEERAHFFTVVVQPTASTRALLDDAVPPPACHLHAPGETFIWPNGTYPTVAGQRQRYRCVSKTDPEGMHSFSAPLPRALVDEETCCRDCEVLTPRHAGTEAASRRLNIPTPVVVSVLQDLADGRAYTAASRRALEQMKRPVGRVRHVGGKPPEDLNAAGLVGPERELKAHWHISADILERFGPFLTETAFAAVRQEERKYRNDKLPVVYFADEVPVKRDYARSSSLTTAPVVWTALVVSRTRWERDSAGTVTGRSSRLVRVRALPNASAEAWRLVLSELEAPDFVVCDGAATIEKAAQAVWGRSTTVVPCMWHAIRNIEKHLTPARERLPDKVRDHLYVLTRDLMRQGGAGAVTTWFDELEVLAAADALPGDLVGALRQRYQPLLQRTAVVACSHNSPPVQVSNASVEALIQSWVKRLTTQRGAMFSNLARTNLLGDLVVAASNGALLDALEVARTLRHAARDGQGWVPPPRALTEPVGVLGLRDAFSVLELLERESS